MSKFEDVLVNRIVDQARKNAVRGRENFPLSRAAGLLASDALSRAIEGVGRVLADEGYVGEVYVEQADIGNGKEDISPISVLVTGNGDQDITGEHTKTLPSSTRAVLNSFPN